MARLLFNDNLISAKMPRSNGETLAWYEDCLLNGKVSEEKIKQESIKFFQLTTKESAKSKQIFKKDIQQFVTKHVNMQKCLTREYLGAHGGHGKHQENPPEEFERDIDDEKKRRLAFLKFGREGMKSSQKYKAWLEQDCQLFVKTNELSEKDVDKEVEIIPKEKTNEIHLTRERSSGKNIFDAEKIIISKQQDGTMKKSVIKETYARITLRKRHQDNKNDQASPLTGAGELKTEQVEAALDLLEQVEAARDLLEQVEAARDLLEQVEAARDLLEQVEAARDLLEQVEAARDLQEQVQAAGDLDVTLSPDRKRAFSPQLILKKCLIPFEGSQSRQHLPCLMSTFVFSFAAIPT